MRVEREGCEWCEMDAWVERESLSGGEVVRGDGFESSGMVERGEGRL